MAELLTQESTLSQIVAWVKGLFAKKTDVKIYVGTCSTAAATNPKVCTVDEFPTITNNGVTEPVVGTVIGVKFDATNTSTSTTPELNVNGTGAYRIWYNNAALSSTKSPYAGYAHRYNYYVWDGEYWVFLSHSVDNNTTYANYSFGNGLAVQNNTADATAITATYANYALSANGRVSVVFTHDVLANSTLNINTEGAKAIYYYKEGVLSPIEANMIKAHDVATFVYNGTYYVYVSKWFSGSYNDLKDKPTKVSEFTNDSGYLTEETDPTVPSWAKQSTKPSYNTDEITVEGVGANLSTTLQTMQSNINGKQAALQTQTAYSQKGTSTKVPQISTNSLGQVTGITEVDILQPEVPSTASEIDDTTQGQTVQASLDELYSDKVDKETGKGLSANDYTTTEKTKLAGIEAGAEKNVKSDWAQNDTTADDYIKNRTHYVENVSTSDVWYQTGCNVGSGTTSPGGYPATFNITTGNKYNVTISQGSTSKTYEGLTAAYDSVFNGLALRKNWSNSMGMSDTSTDALLLVVQPSNVVLRSADIYGENCTVQVNEVAETVHKLDPKYLPDNVNQLESITTQESSVSGGTNVVTFTQSNGTQTSFNVKNGEKGDTGATGATGPQGPQGATGPQGPKGDDGVSLGEIALTQTVTQDTDKVPSDKAVYDAIETTDKRLPESFMGTMTTFSLSDFPQLNPFLNDSFTLVHSKPLGSTSASELFSFYSNSARFTVQTSGWQYNLRLKTNGVEHNLTLNGMGDGSQLNSNSCLIAMSFNLVSGVYKLYINGVMAKTGTIDVSYFPSANEITNVSIASPSYNMRCCAIMNGEITDTQALDMLNLYPNNIISLNTESLRGFGKRIINFTRTYTNSGCTITCANGSFDVVTGSGRSNNVYVRDAGETWENAETLRYCTYRMHLSVTEGSFTLIGLGLMGAKAVTIYDSNGDIVGTGRTTLSVGEYDLVYTGVFGTGHNAYMVNFAYNGVCHFSLTAVTTEILGAVVYISRDTYRGQYWQLFNGDAIPVASGLAINYALYALPIETNASAPQYPGQLRFYNNNVYIGYIQGATCVWKQINNS